MFPGTAECTDLASVSLGLVSLLSYQVITLVSRQAKFPRKLAKVGMLPDRPYILQFLEDVPVGGRLHWQMWLQHVVRGAFGLMYFC